MRWGALVKSRLIGVGAVLILSSLLWGGVPTLVFGQTGTASPTPTEITLETVIAQTLSARASVTARAAAFTKTPSNTPDLAKSAAAAISASDTAQAIASFTATPCPSRQPLIIVISATPATLTGVDATRAAAEILETAFAEATQMIQVITAQPTVTATPCNNPVFIVVSPTPLPTLPPTWTPSASPTATPEGICPTYTVQAGDTPGAIANIFGVSIIDLLKANGLTEETAALLQIGQQLVIPVAGCTPLLPSNTVPAATEAPPSTGLAAPIEVVGVIDPGKAASEGIQLRNVSGAVLDLQHWIMSDYNGHNFTFPAVRLFPNGQITVYTRMGNNTPIALFWGLPSAVWLPGTTATIQDAQGNIVVQFQVK